MKTKVVDKKGKKRLLSETSTSFIKSNLKQGNTNEFKKDSKRIKLAGIQQNKNKNSTSEEKALTSKVVDKTKSNMVKLLETKKDIKGKTELIKSKKETSDRTSKLRKRHPYNNLNLSVEQITKKIAEIKSREILSKRAKKILGVLNRKLRECENKSENLDTVEKKNNKKAEHSTNVLINNKKTEHRANISKNKNKANDKDKTKEKFSEKSIQSKNKSQEENDDDDDDDGIDVEEEDDDSDVEEDDDDSDVEEEDDDNSDVEDKDSDVEEESEEDESDKSNVENKLLPYDSFMTNEKDDEVESEEDEDESEDNEDEIESEEDEEEVESEEDEEDENDEEDEESDEDKDDENKEEGKKAIIKKTILSEIRKKEVTNMNKQEQHKNKQDQNKNKQDRNKNKQERKTKQEQNNNKQEQNKNKESLDNQQKEGIKKKRYVLFVGNLPLNITENDIREHFLTKVDTITSIRIPTKPDQTPRGFAYVEVTNNIDFEKGLSLNHTFLKKRRINVQYSIPMGGKKVDATKKLMIAKNMKLQALQKAGKLADGNQKKKPFKKEK